MNDALSSKDAAPPSAEIASGQKNGSSRRAFLGQLGGAAAATVAASALAAGPLATEAHAQTGSGVLIGQGRANASKDIRVDAARSEREVLLPRHKNNGDESRYPNKIGSYSKGLPHNSFGEVDLAAYATLITAVSSGAPQDFENITLGGNTKLTNPQCGLAYDLEGTDSHQLLEIPPPRVDSQTIADVAIENYWMALLRDIGFTDYDTDPLAARAIAELDSLPAFTGPKLGGHVTAQTLFRGFTAGDLVGPYISQFLMKPFAFGVLPISQLNNTYAPAVDYMTDQASWLAVQNGQGPFGSNQLDTQVRCLRNGRDISAWVHVDVLFQAYFHAFLVLAGSGCPVNPGNPYKTSATQAGFGTFGGPFIAGILGEVAICALKAQWFQKWFVHRHLRPEAFGGLVHMTLSNQSSYPLHHDVLHSQAVAQVYADHGTWLLPIAFPEGSPTHPSYGSGHATVAGACVTILKAWFDGTQQYNLMPKGDNSIVVAAQDGLSLVPYGGSDADQITVTGELNKVASNIAIGRNIAGVHWRYDATNAMLLGEAVALSILNDQAKTLNESFAGFTFTKFDGTQITVGGNQ